MDSGWLKWCLNDFLSTEHDSLNEFRVHEQSFDNWYATIAANSASPHPICMCIALATSAGAINTCVPIYLHFMQNVRNTLANSR